MHPLTSAICRRRAACALLLLGAGAAARLPAPAGAQEAGLAVPNLPGYQARALWSEKRGWVLAFDQFDNPAGPRRIFAAHSSDGRKWSPPARLSPALPTLTAPALVDGPGDKVYLFGVASQDMKAYAPQVWTSADGKTWSDAAPVPLRMDGASVVSISVAAAGRGELLAAYQYVDAANQNRATLAFARSTDGQKWTDARVALADRRRPNLFVAPDGGIHLAYQGTATAPGATTSVSEVFTRRTTDFKAWTPEVQATHDGNSHDGWLSAGRGGELLLTYVSVRQGKTSFDLQRAQSKDKGATWTWERSLCDTPEMEYAPAVVAGPAGARALLFSRGNPAQGTALFSLPAP
jgi:hypothetical protein